ncbi:hypothetical protein, partial [Hymenobacter sp. B1770]|uniref:hypothetical protein n=1 Tax=Hymenobacter sp. B1770 TaxID=1718788 RepID=UPI003CF3E323
IGIYRGDNRYNDRLPNDQTRAFREQQRQAYGQHLTSLHALTAPRSPPRTGSATTSSTSC